MGTAKTVFLFCDENWKPWLIGVCTSRFLTTKKVTKCIQFYCSLYMASSTLSCLSFTPLQQAVHVHRRSSQHCGLHCPDVFPIWAHGQRGDSQRLCHRLQRQHTACCRHDSRGKCGTQSKPILSMICPVVGIAMSLLVCLFTGHLNWYGDSILWHGIPTPLDLLAYCVMKPHSGVVSTLHRVAR